MRRTRIAIGALAGLLLAGGAAWAGKPGGGGGGPVDTGTIYFSVATGSTYQIYAMNPNGTGKTALPVYSPSYDGPADPSHALHGGHRWFLIRLDVPGANREFFAIRDDGTSVRLTYTTPDVAVTTVAKWGPQDTTIAWYQRRGTMSDGVCVADVAFDGAGNVAGLVSTPNAPAIPSPAGASGTGGFDWSPDGTRLAMSDRFEAPSQHYVLRTVNLATLASVTLVTGSNGDALQTPPAWSPDGVSIAYDTWRDLRAINADGTNDHLVEAGGYSGSTYTTFTSPRWSPNGVNLAFQYGVSRNGSGRRDVGRCVPTGGAVTNLSSDLASTTCLVIGWR